MRLHFSLLAAALGLVAFLGAGSAHAQGIGLGIVVGDPTGITLKVPLSGNSALDFTIGADAGDFDDDDGEFYVQWLYSPAIIGRSGGVTIPFYFGIGGLVEFDDNGNADDDFDIGARVPVGIAFEFSGPPIELFLELGLEIIFIDNGLGDDDFDADGVLGIRFYF